MTKSPLLTAAEKLSPPLRAVLSLKVLMGGLCRSALLDVLKTAEIPPPTGQVWTQTALRATEHTLSGLHLLDSANAPVSGLESQAMYAVELPQIFWAFFHVLAQKEQGAHRIEPLRLGLRLAIFANDLRGFLTTRSRFANILDWNSDFLRPLKNQFQETIDPQWWSTRLPLFRAEIFMEHAACWTNGVSVPSFDMELNWFSTAPDSELALLAHTVSGTGETGLHALVVLALSGASDRLKTLPVAPEPHSAPLPQLPQFGLTIALGVAAFCESEFALARKFLEEGRKRLRQTLGRRTVHLGGIEGLCLGLCLLLSRDKKQADELEKLIKAMKKAEGVQRGLHALAALLFLSRGDVRSAASELNASYAPGATPFEDALFYAALTWADPKTAASLHGDMAALFDKHRHMLVPARMLAVLLERNAADPAPYTRWLKTCPTPAPDILALLGGSSVWERQLETLEHLLRGDAVPATPAAQRLAWLLDPTMPLLTPLQQSPKGSGWTTGRPVALKRLHEAGPEQTWITPQDRRVIATIEWRPNWSGGLHGEFNMPRALDELVGHPCILHAISREPLSLSREDVALEVRETPSGYELALSLPTGSFQGAPLLSQNQSTPSAWVCHHVPPELRPILPSLSAQPLRIPKAGAGRIMDFVSACAPHVPLRTNLATGTVDASVRPVIRLSPTSASAGHHGAGTAGSTGLRVEFLVRPFGMPVTANTPVTAGLPESPAFPPGSGPLSPLFRVDGHLVRTRRDMNAEREALRSLLALCPTLAAEILDDDDMNGADSAVHPKIPAKSPPALTSTDCTLSDMATSLQALLELQQAAEALPENLRPALEWPLGQHFRVIPSPTAERLTLRARKAGDWFRLEGQATLQADLHAESRVLEMSELLAKLEQSSGLFVPLGNGEFLALTRQLRRRLERLRRLTEQDRDHSRRIHPLAAGAVDDLFAETQSDADIQTDAAWQEGIRLLRTSEGITPQLPSTLKADLRDYQLEGFQWLSRLARLNAGACLADDMGLGKTVQTLAAMLEQAPHGPCLVVAPMSVCHNWEAEAARFAPTLTIHRLGLATDRAALILSLGPSDVLVLSYNLLQIEEAALTTPFWRMIVFDEAQALKNPATKRTKAARNLRAGFRVALTGTPIENQLEDLWSLFHILNPGLLGTLMSFRKRFSAAGLAQDASGSETREDRNPAKAALKAMIRPFILRRTKTAVLTELPPRTEQVLTVELPPDERALYEAMRRKALEQIEALNAAHTPNDAAAGQRRLAILGELTRLRRACCHPALIDPQTPLPGAKLEAFLELVRELRQGQHKALVFSQFVGHLHLVREALQRLGARPGTLSGDSLNHAHQPQKSPDADNPLAGAIYQYLDGSTPERERQRAVRAFQDGDGDLFLISLKAGGQGLNLTAADYVIHLDPWWNPAVEDQASDRAHRMGQERPVTIYRLVTADTVEEKILDLHHAKRALAADFLSGADAPLSVNELINLFK